MWGAVNQELGERGGLKDRNQEIRARWAISAGCEAFIELHYNSDAAHAGKGHEVYYDDGECVGGDAANLANEIVVALTNEFPEHPNRGAKPGRYQVLDIARKLSIPAVIVEPAFIHEPLVVTPTWRERYVRAMVSSLSTFFSDDARA